MIDYLAALREASVQCPTCKGNGDVSEVFVDPNGDAYPSGAPCPTCRGSGRVALVPGLAKPCPGVDDGWGVLTHNERCCSKTYQVPVPEPDALAALLEYVRKQCRPWHVDIGPAPHEYYPYGADGSPTEDEVRIWYWRYDQFIKGESGKDVVTVKGSGLDALAEAVARALGLVRDGE